MPPSREEKVADIAEWLQQAFPGSQVEHGYLFDRSTFLLRVHLPSGKSPELEVSDAVLDDNDTPRLLGDLAGHDVAERMRQHPTVRLQYHRDRQLPSFETRGIACDGRRYRIVRDTAGNVRIFDSADRPLANGPKGVLVLQSSIFHRDESQWCADIRLWRGQDQ